MRHACIHRIQSCSAEDMLKMSSEQFYYQMQTTQQDVSDTMPDRRAHPAAGVLRDLRSCLWGSGYDSTWRGFSS